MPTYISRCSICAADFDYVRSISDRNNTPECCGSATVKGLTAPAIGAMSFTGHKGFNMPDGKQGGKGTWIESGGALKKYLRDNNKMSSTEAAAEAQLQKKNIADADTKKRRDAVIKAVEKLT